jgi:hypothetical protein
MTDHTDTQASDHPFTRPGQVAADRPAPDRCMVCGQPEADHRPRPLTYDQALFRQRGFTDAQDRYEALTDRKMAADTVRILRERGEFDPASSVHASMAEREPLSAEDWLEMMAAGEVLARYYRHPSMLDHAAKAGATWDQIGAARGTSGDQARADYRAWAEGQHKLWAGYGDDTAHRFGLDDAGYAAAIARSAGPEMYPGGIGDPASIGIRSGEAARAALRAELARLRHDRETWEEAVQACTCPGPASQCTRRDFRDHAGQPEGCMACAELDPDQPCIAAVAQALEAGQ